MFSNPITSIIGVLCLLCPVVEFVVPEAVGLCANIQKELIGIGFLSTADGIRTRFRAVSETKESKPNA